MRPSAFRGRATPAFIKLNIRGHERMVSPLWLKLNDPSQKTPNGQRLFEIGDVMRQIQSGAPQAGQLMAKGAELQKQLDALPAGGAGIEGEVCLAARAQGQEGHATAGCKPARRAPPKPIMQVELAMARAKEAAAKRKLEEMQSGGAVAAATVQPGAGASFAELLAAAGHKPPAAVTPTAATRSPPMPAVTPTMVPADEPPSSSSDAPLQQEATATNKQPEAPANEEPESWESLIARASSA